MPSSTSTILFSTPLRGPIKSRLSPSKGSTGKPVTPTRARLQNFNSLFNLRALRKPLAPRQDRTLSKELDAFDFGGFGTGTGNGKSLAKKGKGNFATRRRVDSQLLRALAEAPRKAKVLSRTYTVGKMYPYRNIVAGPLCALPVFLITLPDASLGPSSFTPTQTGFFHLDPAAGMDIRPVSGHGASPDETQPFSLANLVEKRSIRALPLFVEDEFYDAHAVSVFVERQPTCDGASGSGRMVEYLGNFFLQSTGTYLPLGSLPDSAKPYLSTRFLHTITSPPDSPVPGMPYTREQVEEMYEKCQIHERVNLVWAEGLSVSVEENLGSVKENLRVNLPSEAPVQTRTSGLRNVDENTRL